MIPPNFGETPHLGSLTSSFLSPSQSLQPSDSHPQSGMEALCEDLRRRICWGYIGIMEKKMETTIIYRVL